MVGSSPLTRGKPWRRAACAIRRWLIPAHAGKTLSAHKLPQNSAAHPRSRGENLSVAIAAIHGQGSSPLTRGKRCRRRPARSASRLIPAHAGKTLDATAAVDAVWAHPRSRGENEAARQPHGWETGSSPLTRGKLRSGIWPRTVDGLIPAHAGKTIWGSPTAGTYKGSSPLTRGKRPRADQRALRVRLIPAHAGKTLSRTPSGPWRTGSSPLTRGKLAFQSVPCGECGLIPAHAGKTSWLAASTPVWVGSSPLTRGKLREGRAILARLGLIPAHAGKTSAPPRWARLRRAHPRSRGENASPSSSRNRARGSSPLTRGKPLLGVVLGQAARLIPAHAGKTSSTTTTTRE